MFRFLPCSQSFSTLTPAFETLAQNGGFWLRAMFLMRLRYVMKIATISALVRFCEVSAKTRALVARTAASSSGRFLIAAS